MSLNTRLEVWQDDHREDNKVTVDRAKKCQLSNRRDSPGFLTGSGILSAFHLTAKRLYSWLSLPNPRLLIVALPFFWDPSLPSPPPPYPNIKIKPPPLSRLSPHHGSPSLKCNVTPLYLLSRPTLCYMSVVVPQHLSWLIGLKSKRNRSREEGNSRTLNVLLLFYCRSTLGTKRTSEDDAWSFSIFVLKFLAQPAV